VQVGRAIDLPPLIINRLGEMLSTCVSARHPGSSWRSCPRSEPFVRASSGAPSRWVKRRSICSPCGKAHRAGMCGARSPPRSRAAMAPGDPRSQQALPSRDALEPSSPNPTRPAGAARARGGRCAPCGADLEVRNAPCVEDRVMGSPCCNRAVFDDR
jgi:hypothetical protein